MQVKNSQTRKELISRKEYCKMENRILTWTAEGVMIDEHTTGKVQGRKGMFIYNRQIFELADKIERDAKHRLIKKKLGDIEGLPGIVMLEINSIPNKKKYQVFCSWMPQWHIQNIGCCIDISYQDDGRGQDGVLSVIVRKKFKDCIKSVSKILSQTELIDSICSISIKHMAEDALIKMDSTNNGEK